MPSEEPGPAREDARATAPSGGRTGAVALLVVYLLSRSLCGWLADHPELYHGRTAVTGDVTLYEYWADRIVQDRVVPYEQVRVEYPPGSLPFIVGPELVPLSYRSVLVAAMLVVDALGLVGVLRVSRRWGSSFGPWLWVLLIPLIGPLVFVRLDLVPAVATIWAVERMAASRWGAAGAWLGVGVATKLYPLVFVPIAVVVSPRRRRTVVATALVIGVAFLPFVFTPRAVVRSVFAYHAGRDIQIESSWGLGLLVADGLSGGSAIGFSEGSFNISGTIAPMLRGVALILSILAIVVSIWIARRHVPRGDAPLLSALMFAILSVLLCVGTIFSPQFVVWLAATGAVAGCARDSPIRTPLIALVPVAALTQVIYPFQYHLLLGAQGSALVTLGLRNGLLLAAGLMAFARVARSSQPAIVTTPPSAA